MRLPDFFAVDTQFTKILQFFSRESFLFLLMEDLIQQPTKTVKTTLDFINVDSKIDLTEKGIIVANKAQDNSEWFIRQELMSPWKKIPGVVQAKALLSQTARDRCYLVLKKIQYQQWQKKQELPPYHVARNPSNSLGKISST
jgi:hypothetical protein